MDFVIDDNNIIQLSIQALSDFMIDDIQLSIQPLSVLIGLSDPYCQLGVLNEVHKEKNTVKQKELQQWKKEKLVGSVVGTKVKQATLEPEWNEEFYL